MKRKNLIALALIIYSYCFPTNVAAQDNVSRFLFKFMETDERMMARQEMYYAPDAEYLARVFDFIKSRANPINDVKPWSPIILGVKLNPKIQNFYSADLHSLTRSYVSYVIPDSSEAEVVALGINKDNVKDYRYRIIENDSVELVPWTKIKLKQDHGAKLLMVQ